MKVGPPASVTGESGLGECHFRIGDLGCETGHNRYL
jgi:hypothetical protein